MITPLTNELQQPETIEREVAPSNEISSQLEKDLVQVFKLLADETRLKILSYLLNEGELHVTALCDRLQQSQPAVSHHLALMRVAGLIEARRDGKHNFYSLRTIHFYRILSEIFSALKPEGQDSIKFEDLLIQRQA